MNSSSPSKFSFVQPRDSVEIHLPAGGVISGPRNAPVGDFLKLLQDHQAGQPASAPVVGAVINGELRELSYQVRMDSRVLYTLTIDHSVSSGGYYCRVSDPLILTELELERLDAQMRELVEQDLPFVRREVPLAEAIAHFTSRGYDDKVRLLSHRQKAYLVLYRLGDHQDYLHGYMVPSTGYLKWFGLALTNGGFTLLFPRRTPNYPKLLKTFRQYGEWLDRLGIASVGVLNDSIKAGKTSEVVLVSEALHEQNVAEIAAQIHIILISGPSSSGKTTFSKRLAIQLLSQGISPFPLEIDNYFVDRELTPRDENGEFDFESLGAVDTTRLVSDLQHLIQGEQVQLPRYNFQQGKSEPGDVVRLQPGQLIILEGIHGLNPDLLPSVSTELTFRIYTSCLTQLNLDRHNRISTTDTRLLRRIVRDARERGYSARDTIQRWDSVRRGEKRYIFPYQENADVMFNSALAYDVSVLKPLVEPLLRQVPFGTPEYIEAKRLLALMEWFLPIELGAVPGNSIIREFTGGSILKDFKLWHNQ